MTEPHWLNDLPRAPRERVKLAILAVNDARQVMADPVRVEAVAAMLKAVFMGASPAQAGQDAAKPYGAGTDGAAIATMLTEFAEALTTASETVERFGIGDTVIVWTPTGYTLARVEGSHDGEALFLELDRRGVEVVSDAVQVITHATYESDDAERWRGAHAGLRPGDRFPSAAAVLAVLNRQPGRETRKPAKKVGRKLLNSAVS